jgi:myosin protein heavy chain
MNVPVLTNATTHTRHRSQSNIVLSRSNTFAPSFIKTEELQRRAEAVSGIEGENDFSGKRYVWLKDPVTAFVRGWIVEELGNGQLLVQCDDGSVRVSILLHSPAPLTSLTAARG